MIYESDYIWKIGPASQDLIEVPQETLQKAAFKFRDLAVIGNRILKYLKNKRYVEEKFFGLIKKETTVWEHYLKKSQSFYAGLGVAQMVMHDGYINPAEMRCLRYAISDYPGFLTYHLTGTASEKIYLTEEHFEQLNKILNIDLTLVSTEYMIGIRVE